MSTTREKTTLAPTQLLIFGNPKVGTPLMKCGRTVAIDLPQKLLVWQNSEGTTSVAYNDPVYLGKRHQLSQACNALLKKVAGVLEAIALDAIR